MFNWSDYIIKKELSNLLKNADIYDKRQQSKVRHKFNEIIGITLFALLSGSETWEEIEDFAVYNEKILKNYFTLENGIASHDTIQRVFAIFSAEIFQQYREKFNELLNSQEGNKIRKILAIDGKTQRGNAGRGQKANHIVSCVDNNGFCLGEKLVDDKSNEIIAIPELIKCLNVKGQIITTDAMGTQKEIVKEIRKKKADYVLALKGNHKEFHDDVKQYFNDQEFLNKCAKHRTVEKARSSIEIREYWQTDNIKWLPLKDWADLKSIIMTRNTIKKADSTITETRYFISSLELDVKEVAKAIRSHWMVESYHWHLDVTFREDNDHTLEKQAAFNLNILRKLALNILKLLDIGRPRVSLRRKRKIIGWNPIKYFGELLKI